MPCFKPNNKCLVREPQDKLQKGPQKVRPGTAPNQAKPTDNPAVVCAQKPRQPHKDDFGDFKLMGVVAPISTCLGAKARTIVPQKVYKKEKKTLLRKTDVDRLQTAAKVYTIEDRVADLNQHESERIRNDREVQRARDYFKKVDDARKRAIEARTEKEDLYGEADKARTLERAFLAKHEQEEEIKILNRCILNAKCNAVRDAQIQEKTDIERRLREDTICLEKVVVDRAAEGLKQDEANEEVKKEKQMKYAREITAQLVARQNMRFLEAERLEEEAVMLRKQNEAIKREEQRQKQLDRERKMKFRDELRKLSEMAAIFKKMLCEHERETDIRIAEYIRAKRQKEKELAAEKQLEKDTAECRRQRIFELAQKRLEAKSTSEELAFIREQERIEREYRRKEKEAAMRKHQLEKELLEAREAQLAQTKLRIALQMTREEEVFNVFVEQVKQEQKQEEQKKEMRAKQNKCHRDGIICQMNEKEMARRQLLEKERNEAMARRQMEDEREKTLKAVITAKLRALQEVSLPTKYIHEIELQLRKVQTLNKVPPKNCPKN